MKGIERNGGVTWRACGLAVLGLSAALMSGCGDDICWGECDQDTRSFTVEMGEITLQPGEEHIFCVFKRIGNTEQMRIGKIESTISQATHHVVVFLSYGTEEKLEPGRCGEFMFGLDPSREIPLLVTQRQNEVMEFPDGVGLTIDANQMVKLEMHFANTSDQVTTVNTTQTFHELVESDYEMELGFFAVQTTDVFLAAKSDVEIGPLNLAIPPDMGGVNLFSLQGHTHERGKNVRIATVTADGDATMAYNPGEDYDWEEPDIVYPDPPLVLPAGGAIRWSCDYRNDTSADIMFGSTSEHEMCMFWGHYYPQGDLGNRVCMRSEFNGGFQGCCPGDQWLCDFLMEVGAEGF